MCDETMRLVKFLNSIPEEICNKKTEKQILSKSIENYKLVKEDDWIKIINKDKTFFYRFTNPDNYIITIQYYEESEINTIKEESFVTLKNALYDMGDEKTDKYQKIPKTLLPEQVKNEHIYICIIDEDYLKIPIMKYFYGLF
jgi:hypothetical protein